MFLKILIVVAIIVIVFLIIVAAQAPTFRVSRSINVSAPPSIVFDRVNDLHHWPEWSPWTKLDPQMKETFSGASSGIGASYAWVGNKKVGAGQMTIIESHPQSLVRFKLEFLRPFAATHAAEFTLDPIESGQATKVTWTMTGEKNFAAKMFGLFVNMDKMLGGDFEKGLSQLKALYEKSAQP